MFFFGTLLNDVFEKITDTLESWAFLTNFLFFSSDPNTKKYLKSTFDNMYYVF